jgi:hypothetical protein
MPPPLASLLRPTPARAPRCHRARSPPSRPRLTRQASHLRLTILARYATMPARLSMNRHFSIPHDGADVFCESRAGVNGRANGFAADSPSPPAIGETMENQVPSWNLIYSPRPPGRHECRIAVDRGCALLSPPAWAPLPSSADRRTVPPTLPARLGAT